MYDSSASTVETRAAAADATTLAVIANTISRRRNCGSTEAGEDFQGQTAGEGIYTRSERRGGGSNGLQMVRGACSTRSASSVGWLAPGESTALPKAQMAESSTSSRYTPETLEA